MSDLAKSISGFFSKNIFDLIKNKIEFAEEIRLRQKQNILIKYGIDYEEIDYIVNSNDILDILQRICEFSLYSYQNQIVNGYITVLGGHRVGITGSCVFENGQVTNIKYINSLNFRISRQIIGCSRYVYPEIIKADSICNTLIVSPPGYGKTTILKDIIRQLAEYMDVGVVDERGEIAAMYKGVPQNDLGKRIDIIENISKDIGIKMLIRSMAPKVIVVDEIGTKKDLLAINYAFCSGVKGIFTCHGDSYNNLISNPVIKDIIFLNVLDKIIFLDKEKGKIKEVMDLGEENKCII